MFLNGKRGFTLVELLVVMTIVALATGLVGGLAVNGYTKYQMKAEVMTIERLIARANVLSFATEQPLTLQMDKDELVLRSVEKTLFRQLFDYTQLPTESIVFNRKGLPSKSSITVRVSGKNRTIPLVKRN